MTYHFTYSQRKLKEGTIHINTIANHTDGLLDLFEISRLIKLKRISDQKKLQLIIQMAQTLKLMIIVKIV